MAGVGEGGGEGGGGRKLILPLRCRLRPTSMHVV